MPFIGSITASPGGNLTLNLLNDYSRITRLQREESTGDRPSNPRWQQTANGIWTPANTTNTTTVTGTDGGGAHGASPVQPTVTQPPAPEMCCICMGEAATFTLEPCNHSSFCGTCAALLFAGAVSASPQCPLCREVITGYAETPVAPTAQPPTVPAETVEENLAPDVLNILRRSRTSATETGLGRIGQLLRQLQELRDSQASMFSDFAWARHEDDEPYILPDTGARDGLCGDQWAIHAGAWAAKHGHKWTCSKLAARRAVSGVGQGVQHVEDKFSVPIGLEDKKGKHHLGDFKAAVIRNSNLPALLGIDSLSKQNAVIRCRTGEIWFMDSAGCDIKPKGNHVHLQMVKSKSGSGHWFLPVGRFNEVMTRLGQASTDGHLATASTTPASGQPSCSSAE